MFLFVGLGNPGKSFMKTRHNVGFMALDEFKKQNDFPPFCMENDFEAEISEKEKIILAKPQTFMNLSGRAVKKIINYYKISIGNLMVLQDEIDLPLGDFKISLNRNSAGHRGVESIINELKTKNFARLRIGIKNSEDSKISADKFVLEKFSPQEEKILAKTLKEAVDLLSRKFIS